MMQDNISRYYLNINKAQPYSLSGKVLPVMNETLGELIQRRMKDLGIKNNSELATKIGKSDAYVGDLVNDRAKTKSGIYRPRPATIEKLSKVLDISVDEILQTIGYKTKQSSSKKPTNVRELFEALEQLGLELHFDGGMDKLEQLGEESLQEILDGIVANASVKVKRAYKDYQN